MKTFIGNVDRAALAMQNENMQPVRGIGPTRNLYFLSNEVIRGSQADGFHRTERPLVGKSFIVDGTRYCEFEGFVCANRTFKVNIL